MSRLAAFCLTHLRPIKYHGGSPPVPQLRRAARRRLVRGAESHRYSSV